MSVSNPRPATRLRSPEHDEQSALIRWRDMFAPTEPRLKWLHASLNGVKLTQAQAGKAKAAGMTPGVWDLFLPVPFTAPPSVFEYTITPGGVSPAITGPWGGYRSWHICGLYIEMKGPRGKLTPEQVAFRGGVEPAYLCRVCRSWAEAALTICDYLGLPESHPARKAAQ